MPSENFESQEMELNVVDMLWSVVMKWRVMFVIGVTFAILAGLASYMMSVKSIENAQHTENLTIELSDESLERVQDYLGSWEAYQERKEYNDNSYLMQLDGNNFYKTTLCYYIDNKYEVVYPQIEKSNNMDVFLAAYSSLVEKDEFYESLPEFGTDGNKVVYYKEIIDFGNRYGGGEFVLRNGNLLVIAIYHKDKEECVAIANQVDAVISAGKAAVTSTLGEHDIRLVNRECILTADSDLLDYQNRNVSTQNTLRTSMTNMEKTLTSDELAYIQQTVQEADATMESDEDGEQEENVETVVLKPSVSKKLVVLGFLGGIVLAAGVVVLAYLFRTRISYRDDFEKLYGVKLLGTVLCEDKKKKLFGFVDRFLTRIRDCRRRYFKEDEAIAMVAAGIKILSRKAGVDTVFVTGTNIVGDESEFVKKLQCILAKNDIKVVQGTNILYDPASLEKMAELGNVVLVEEADRSLYEEIKREIETCCYHNVEVLGAVVLGNN